MSSRLLRPSRTIVKVFTVAIIVWFVFISAQSVIAGFPTEIGTVS